MNYATLKNTFHNHYYSSNKTREEIDDLIYRVESDTADPADYRWAAKVRRSLCGVSGCLCGQNILNERD